MRRIRRLYEARFRAWLAAAGARRPEQGVQWLLAKAQRLAADQGLSPPEALARVYDSLAARPRLRPARPVLAASRFFCDAGLGGLARWLRAAGYEALWEDGIEDDDLLRRARETSAAILTTDSLLMERRLLRDGVISALWLPPSLTIPAQLALVFREFRLTLREARCMACGGELRRADKEALRERIPPRTYRWLNEYFLCAGCGQLFWHGTHWERIRRELERTLTRQH